jgi:hypothetical protein
VIAVAVFASALVGRGAGGVERFGATASDDRCVFVMMKGPDFGALNRALQ